MYRIYRLIEKRNDSEGDTYVFVLSSDLCIQHSKNEENYVRFGHIDMELDLRVFGWAEYSLYTLIERHRGCELPRGDCLVHVRCINIGRLRLNTYFLNIPTTAFRGG